jgi:deazaflavin-dependent oxidoreductase (nitroreductase family)
MTMPDDLLAHNRGLIDQFRADGGASMGNRPLLLLTTVGRRTGQRRTSPMMYVKAEDRLLVIASNNGATTDPDWYRNLTAAGTARVEVGTEEYPVSVSEVTGEERDRIYAEQARRYPGFGEYEEKTKGIRTIPVLALRREA